MAQKSLLEILATATVFYHPHVVAAIGADELLIVCAQVRDLEKLPDPVSFIGLTMPRHNLAVMTTRADAVLTKWDEFLQGGMRPVIVYMTDGIHERTAVVDVDSVPRRETAGSRNWN